MELTGFDRRARPPGAHFSQWRAPDGWVLRRMDWPQPEGAPGTLVFAGGRADFIEKYLEPLAHWHRARVEHRLLRLARPGPFAWAHRRRKLHGFRSARCRWGGADCRGDRAVSGPHVAIAHSMGGHLLLRILAEHQPALAAAVLVAPMLAVNTSPAPEALGRALAATFCRLGLTDALTWRESGTAASAGRIRQANLTHCP
jgi:lysophospholipase